MMELAEPRVELEVVAHIVHPAHVPLEGEAQPAVRDRIGHERPRGRFLRHHHHVRINGKSGGVERAQEVDGLQVLVAAVFVRRPLTRFAPVVEVEHGRYRVHAQAVKVVFPQPVGGGREQEALHLAAPVVEYARAPARVLALFGVGVLVARLAVEVDEAVLVLAEVRGHPVKNDGDAPSVHHVHEVHEVVRRAVARGRREVAGALVAPRVVERILGHGHQLHAVVAEVGGVLAQLVCERAVVVKIAVFAPPPRAEMHLVDVERTVIDRLLCRKVRAVAPVVARKLVELARRAGARLGVEGVGVGLEGHRAALRGDGELIGVIL